MLPLFLRHIALVVDRELKKMRTQRRQAREKEKQELIRWVLAQASNIATLR